MSTVSREHICASFCNLSSGVGLLVTEENVHTSSEHDLDCVRAERGDAVSSHITVFVGGRDTP